LCEDLGPALGVTDRQLRHAPAAEAQNEPSVFRIHDFQYFLAGEHADRAFYALTPLLEEAE